MTRPTEKDLSEAIKEVLLSNGRKLEYQDKRPTKDQKNARWK